MNKILLIIKREYLSRVRKKSFIIMTILGPVLMACLILAPILLMDSSDEEKKEVWVCDENNLFEPQFEDILNKYNHLLTQDYSQPCQFQREMIKLHKDSYFSKYNQFKAFFNNQFSFQQAYQFISKRKKNDTPKSFQKRYQQFFIYTTSGLKVYLLADKLSTNIWIIFRGTDELQNKSSNLSSQLQQINAYSLTALGLLFNKSNLGISLGDCGNHYNSQIFRLLSEAIHTIFNGILY